MRYSRGTVVRIVRAAATLIDLITGAFIRHRFRSLDMIMSVTRRYSRGTVVHIVRAAATLIDLITGAFIRHRFRSSVVIMSVFQSMQLAIQSPL